MKFHIDRDLLDYQILNWRWGDRLIVTSAPNHVGFCVSGDEETGKAYFLVGWFDKAIRVFVDGEWFHPYQLRSIWNVFWKAKHRLRQPPAQVRLSR